MLCYYSFEAIKVREGIPVILHLRNGDRIERGERSRVVRNYKKLRNIVKLEVYNDEFFNEIFGRRFIEVTNSLWSSLKEIHLRVSILILSGCRKLLKSISLYDKLQKMSIKLKYEPAETLSKTDLCKLMMCLETRASIELFPYRQFVSAEFLCFCYEKLPKKR